jgi:hypothetical protein
MSKNPELTIDYGGSLRPVAAECSECRERMPFMKAKDASSEETMKWFQVQFHLHVRRKHTGKRWGQINRPYPLA